MMPCPMPAKPATMAALSTQYEDAGNKTRTFKPAAQMRNSLGAPDVRQALSQKPPGSIKFAHGLRTGSVSLRNTGYKASNSDLSS